MLHPLSAVCRDVATYVRYPEFCECECSSVNDCAYMYVCTCTCMFLCIAQCVKALSGSCAAWMLHQLSVASQDVVSYVRHTEFGKCECSGMSDYACTCMCM